VVNQEIPRYSRHTLLRVMGEDGQEKVRNSRVFVAGLGALGSLISILLARAGVGFLRIADQDAPEIHNLHRQILYDESDVESGLSKAEIARRRLLEANSEIRVEAVPAVIGPDNVHELIQGVDLVVDALDNIRSRYPVNDAILDQGIPYVFGGAVETVGNIMTIIPGETPCLRCLWPDPEAVENHPRASEVGVLSAAATAVASLEVVEALKILMGKRDEILPGLLVMDLWRGWFHVAPIAADPHCKCRELRDSRPGTRISGTP
jgi:molybdopterin-synthase adenylyltransferase